MLHLISVDTSDEADEIAQRFHTRGIPVFVEPDYTRTDPSARGTSFGFRVHIWLKEQSEDAKRLLRDPDYGVMAPVDVASSMLRWSNMMRNEKPRGIKVRRSGSTGSLALGRSAWLWFVFAALAS